MALDDYAKDTNHFVVEDHAPVKRKDLPAEGPEHSLRNVWHAGQSSVLRAFPKRIAATGSSPVT